MSTPPIRLAQNGDLNAVQCIVEAAYSPYIARLGKPPGPMRDDFAAHISAGRCHVLGIEGRIVGLSVVLNDSDRFILDNVAVDPACQGRGFGRMLVDHAEGLCRAAGYGELWLYTHVLMTENIPLYTHLGFEQMHRVTEIGYDRIYMMKAL